MTGVERILDRAIHSARAGQCNPGLALVDAQEADAGDKPTDQGRALMAVMEACGGSLVRWYEQRLARPRLEKVASTVALLEEALFNVQMRGEE